MMFALLSGLVATAGFTAGLLGGGLVAAGYCAYKWREQSQRRED
jgi:hypothetical protein